MQINEETTKNEKKMNESLLYVKKKEKKTFIHKI